MSNDRIVKLSKTTELNKDSDLFLISRLGANNNVYSSYKFSFVTVHKQVIDDLIIPAKKYIINKKWTFEKPIEIKTSSITERTSVINKEYADKLFNKLFDQLYREIYVTRIPSYIGEIIYSTTLKTEGDVKKHYGEESSWKQIPGRFLKGKSNGKYRAFNTFGATFGEIQHRFTVREIPPHVHDFIPSDSDSQTFSASATYTAQFSDEPLIVYKSEAYSVNSGSSSGYAVMDKKLNVDCELSKGGRLYGNKGSSCKIGVPKNAKNLPHNNIPPYYAVYIWRRVF